MVKTNHVNRIRDVETWSNNYTGFLSVVCVSTGRLTTPQGCTVRDSTSESVLFLTLFSHFFTGETLGVSLVSITTLIILIRVIIL